MILRPVHVAELVQAGSFAELEHDEANSQIRAWWRAGASEAAIVVATKMGVEAVRRAIGGIVTVPRS